MNRRILKSILVDYQNEIPKHNVIPREFRLDWSRNFLFVGIRGAGKSFLLFQRIRQLLEAGTGWDEILYLNFEDERLDGMDSQFLDFLLETHIETYGKRPILFLDEIQNVDGWEKFARQLADYKYRVYIAGSNAKMLSKEILSTLGKRYIGVEIHPYNFSEYLTVNDLQITPSTFYDMESRAGILRLFDSYLRMGGFPEGAALKSRREKLTGIYHNIIFGDIATLHSIENTSALKVMFRKIAEGVQQPVSFNKLAKIVSSSGAKVGTNTIINYMGYAQDAWLVTPISNIAERLVEKVKSYKFYFTDNGILNLFLVDSEVALLENLVASTLLRRYGSEDAVFFYNHDVEVDFYVPEDEIAIQVCYSLSDAMVFNGETKALAKIATMLRCQKLLIITRNEEEIAVVDGKQIDIIPIWKWILPSYPW